MKNRILVCTAAVMVVSSIPLRAQFQQNEELADDFAHDLELYVGAYTRPALDMFAPAMYMDQSLFRTDEEPWKFTFDLVTGMTFYGSEPVDFNFDALDMRRTDLENPDDNMLPTAIGDRSDNVMLFDVGTQGLKAEIPVLDGVDAPFKALPMVWPRLNMTIPGGVVLSFKGIPYFRVRGVNMSVLGLHASYNLERSIASMRESPWNFGLEGGVQYAAFFAHPDFADNDDVEGEGQMMRFQSWIGQGEFFTSYSLSENVHAFASAGAFWHDTRFVVVGTYRYTWESTGLSSVFLQDATYEVEDPVNVGKTGVVPAFRMGMRFELGGKFVIAPTYQYAGFSSAGLNLGWQF